VIRIARKSRAVGVLALLWLLGTASGLAQAPPIQPSSSAIPDSRTPLIATGRALEDIDKSQRSSQRTINRRQHQPPDEYQLPRPNLAPPPPLTLSVVPIPLPDPRPPVLFNKNFPSLHFQREDEFGFTGQGG
jgi:hypothetical protein